MFRRFGTVPFISECSLWVEPQFQVYEMNLNLKVAFSTCAWTSNEVKISVEAARLACPESKDKTHFLLLPLFVPIAEFDPRNSLSSTKRGISYIKQQIAEKRAARGISYRDLKNVLEKFGAKGLVGVLSLPPSSTTSKAPRATKTTHILAKIVKRFKAKGGNHKLKLISISVSTLWYTFRRSERKWASTSRLIFN